MISAILFAAIVRTLSAIAKASDNFRSPYISRNRSLAIISKASTYSSSSSIPVIACSILRLPSKLKGTVTIPMVRIPNSFACRAISGAAPVPVPPPIPAVINTIRVLCSRIVLIKSILSIADRRPLSGWQPAPRPSVSSFPNWIRFFTRLWRKACISVLQTTNSTP